MLTVTHRAKLRFARDNGGPANCCLRLSKRAFRVIKSKPIPAYLSCDCSPRMRSYPSYLQERSDCNARFGAFFIAKERIGIGRYSSGRDL